jgi:hypothetical protein
MEKETIKEIRNIESLQRYYRKKWIDLDIKLNILKKRLEKSGSKENTNMSNVR